MCGEGVGGGWEPLAHIVGVVLYAVDEFLGVLNPHAHSPRLGFEEHSSGVEHLVDVVCRVTRCEDYCCALHKGIAIPHAHNSIILNLHIGNPLAKVDFATCGDDCFAYLLNDFG